MENVNKRTNEKMAIEGLQSLNEHVHGLDKQIRAYEELVTGKRHIIHGHNLMAKGYSTLGYINGTPPTFPPPIPIVPQNYLPPKLPRTHEQRTLETANKIVAQIKEIIGPKFADLTKTVDPSLSLRDFLAILRFKVETSVWDMIIRIPELVSSINKRTADELLLNPEDRSSAFVCPKRFRDF